MYKLVDIFTSMQMWRSHFYNSIRQCLRNFTHTLFTATFVINVSQLSDYVHVRKGMVPLHHCKTIYQRGLLTLLMSISIF